MPEIVVAIDEKGANALLDAVIGALDPLEGGGSIFLGAIGVDFVAAAKLTNGDVDLIAPDIIRIVDLVADLDLMLTLKVDLNKVLPEFCLPEICVSIPCDGELCTPSICLPWPSLTVKVPFRGLVAASVDLKLLFGLSGSDWRVEAELVGLPEIHAKAMVQDLIAKILTGIKNKLLPVPLLEGMLEMALNAIVAAFAAGPVHDFVASEVSDLLTGLRIELHTVPGSFEVLPAEGPLDPGVRVTIDALSAAIVSGPLEDELVLAADISR